MRQRPLLRALRTLPDPVETGTERYLAFEIGELLAAGMVEAIPTARLLAAAEYGNRVGARSVGEQLTDLWTPSNAVLALLDWKQ